MKILDKVKDTFIKPTEEEKQRRNEEYKAEKDRRMRERHDEQSRKAEEKAAYDEAHHEARLVRAKEKGKERGSQPTTKEYLKERLDIKARVGETLKQRERQQQAYRTGQVSRARSAGSQSSTARAVQPRAGEIRFPGISPHGFGQNPFEGASPFNTSRKPPRFPW